MGRSRSTRSTSWTTSPRLYASSPGSFKPGGRIVIGVGDPEAMAKLPFTEHGFHLRAIPELEAAILAAGLKLVDHRRGSGRKGAGAPFDGRPSGPKTGSARPAIAGMRRPPDRIVYVGHATVLIELDGVRLLTDPVLGEWVGPLRRHGPAPRARGIAERLDAVLISHLHRDHVDLRSLRRARRRRAADRPRRDARLLRARGPRRGGRARAGRVPPGRPGPRHRHRGRPRDRPPRRRGGAGRLPRRGLAARLLRRRHRPLRRHGGARREGPRPRPAAGLGMGPDARPRPHEPGARRPRRGAARAAARRPDPLGHASIRPAWRACARAR